jgi:para-nitrobenzyl esterase
MLRLGPVVDGRSLPAQPWDPTAPALSAHVPVIVGTCKDEARWLFGSQDASLFALDATAMRARLAQLRDLPEEDLDTLIAAYRTVHPTASPSDLFFLIASDRIFRVNAIAQAERKTRQGVASAYMYYFTYGPPIQDGRFQAFHTAELPLALRLVRYPESEQVSRQLAGAWAAFARTGDPSQPGLAWPAYTPDRRATMMFGGEGGAIVDDPHHEARLALQSLPNSGSLG